MDDGTLSRPRYGRRLNHQQAGSNRIGRHSARAASESLAKLCDQAVQRISNHARQILRDRCVSPRIAQIRSHADHGVRMTERSPRSVVNNKDHALWAGAIDAAKPQYIAAFSREAWRKAKAILMIMSRDPCYLTCAKRALAVKQHDEEIR